MSVSTSQKTFRQHRGSIDVVFCEGKPRRGTPDYKFAVIACNKTRYNRATGKTTVGVDITHYGSIAEIGWDLGIVARKLKIEICNELLKKWESQISTYGMTWSPSKCKSQFTPEYTTFYVQAWSVPKWKDDIKKLLRDPGCYRSV